ncbi:MAG: 50S ribosomal protein L7/L12 [Anaerolineae bacterium]|nr:MAG: 50S ribosomal protein L7/L12 [Anaerolineae bacterium]
MADLKKLADQLSKLTVLEAAELTKMLEEEWGVSAAAPVAVAAAPAADGADGAADEKTEFDVVLKDVGPKKIDVIKAIRQITTLGLKDAKELAETPEAKVMEGTGKEAAQEAKSKLEAAGATVDLV